MPDFIEELVAKNGRSSQFAAPPEEVAEELLEPVLRFLKQAGVSERQAASAFANAWQKAARNDREKLELTSLEDPKPFMDLIGIWSRHPDYLDRNGLPRDLPIRGRAGFASLVKRAQCGLGTKRAISLLEAYGNVQPLPNSKVRLTKPFFHIRSNEALAFEPSVRFLLDAAGNVKGSLSRPAARGSVNKENQHFWRSVDSRLLPRSKRKQFLHLVKALSLTFLQDIDDWLSENAAKRPTRSATTRVGLGLFTFESPPE